MSHFFAIKHDINDRFFKSPDSLEQAQYCPLILDWLSLRYGLKPFVHSFRDRWVTFNIWGDKLSISLDFRSPEQSELFENLPAEIKGTKQHGTSKMVNLKTLYFNISDLFIFEYPNIENAELIHTEKSKDNDGDDFRSYTYKLRLSDGTGMYSLSQDTNEPISKQYTYPAKIQERAFLRYLKGLKP